MKKNILKILNNSKGFFSIEAIMSASMVLVILIFILGLSAYQIPKMQLQNNIQTLVQKAKVQGGLTNKNSGIGEHNDVDNFLNTLKSEGFNPDGVKMSLKTKKTHADAIGVSPVGSQNGFYISKDTLDLMILEVSVEPKINKIMGYKMSPYYFTSTFLSERS